MGVINVLDKHVAELIAAGEVVERPSSVIKELVENSIDAHASSITIEIKNGGTSFMRVADNGTGILKDDIKVAFMRHATSKVKDKDDLDKIGTLGFRGEALASISSVSHLELITKSEKDEMGTKYVISGGEEVSNSDIGCPNGTTFIIRDLFYNIPARMKFLKSDQSEGNAVSNIIDKIALSHPEIAITYIKDEKVALKTPGDGKLQSAIYSVYGREFANSLIPVDYQLNGVSVKGYISKPEYSRPNRNMQNFFINNRFIISKTAMAAISEAYKGSIMVGKYPSCVLNIDIPFEAVDVNVHPTKLEVRFTNEKPVFDCVYHGVKSALMIGDKTKEAQITSKPINPFEMAKKVFREKEESNLQKEQAKVNATQKFSPVNTKEANEKIEEDPFSIFTKKSIENAKNKERIIEEKKELIEDKNEQIQKDEINTLIDTDDTYFKFLGEAFSTYILVEISPKELILIDKHAAHERMIFEKLKEEKGSGYSQMLLAPISLTLNKIDYNSVISNLDLFKEASFDIEDFGDGVVLIRAIPQYLDNEDIKSTIEEMAGYITEHKSSIKSEKMEWIYHNVSCRAAIKAGNKSTNEELIDLAKKVLSDDNLKHCPHGRPICISISKREIEKNFGRV